MAVFFPTFCHAPFYHALITYRRCISIFVFRLGHVKFSQGHATWPWINQRESLLSWLKVYEYMGIYLNYTILNMGTRRINVSVHLTDHPGGQWSPGCDKPDGKCGHYTKKKCDCGHYKNSYCITQGIVSQIPGVLEYTCKCKEGFFGRPNDAHYKHCLSPKGKLSWRDRRFNVVPRSLPTPDREIPLERVCLWSWKNRRRPSASSS